MARRRTQTTLWAQYLAARLAAMGLGMVSEQAALRSAAAIGRCVYRFDHRHRQRTLDHLRMGFPDLGHDGLQDLAERSFEHLAQLAVEVCQVPRLVHADSWSHRIRLKNLGKTAELLNSGQPALLVTGHLGNWEITGYLLAVLGYPIQAIARPIDNPLINRWLLDIRQRRGMRIITKWNATDQMLEVIRQGGLLGFIADQNAGDKGLFVPFFGKLASTYKSIGLLAMTQQLPIICGYAVRVSTGLTYEVGIQDIIYPDDWSGQPDPLYYITARYVRAIEEMIKICPHQYLWMHRRWKSRPPHERRGKPFPTVLRQRLEGLPWMKPDELDRLMQPLPQD